MFSFEKLEVWQLYDESLNIGKQTRIHKRR